MRSFSSGCEPESRQFHLRSAEHVISGPAQNVQRLAQAELRRCSAAPGNDDERSKDHLSPEMVLDCGTTAALAAHARYDKPDLMPLEAIQ